MPYSRTKWAGKSHPPQEVDMTAISLSDLRGKSLREVVGERLRGLPTKLISRATGLSARHTKAFRAPESASARKENLWMENQ